MRVPQKRLVRVFGSNTTEQDTATCINQKQTRVLQLLISLTSSVIAITWLAGSLYWTRKALWLVRMLMLSPSEGIKVRLRVLH